MKLGMAVIVVLGMSWMPTACRVDLPDRHIDASSDLASNDSLDDVPSLDLLAETNEDLIADALVRDMASHDARPDRNKETQDGVVDALPRDMAAPRICSSDHWCLESTISQKNTLRDIWGISSSKIWTVGDGGTIVHYDGKTWTTQVSGTTRDLFRLWGSGPTDIWAVGERGTLVHYDGKTWTASTKTNSSLQGVWGSGSSDVWAVGTSGTVIRWKGSTWQVVYLGTTSGFSAIWGSGPADIWAFSYIIYHWDGVAWTKQTGLQNPGGSLSRDVWGASPKSIWAVSEKNLRHFDGSDWRAVFSVAPEKLHGIWGSSDSNVWAVGTGGTIVHGGGVTFTTVASPSSVDLHSIWGSSASKIWAVGSGGTILTYLPASP